ncbi:MAG: metal ABC transporter permease [Gemmataceae bacterium]|nr:metal ABC transporter permease [Gemmataceae bacterium]
MVDWVKDVLTFLQGLMPEGSLLAYDFGMSAMVAIVLTCLVCGAVGSLVVGNRMAFFSDALAHCALAGVALGLLLGALGGADQATFTLWITLATVIFGVVVGLAIAVVRETTGQAHDTVIGVFFAGSIGLGAIFLKVGSGRRYLPPETFLFGNPVLVSPEDLLALFLLLLVTAGLLGWLYNDLTLASFSRSLALSRRVRARLCNYVFIILLALIVNLCLKAVGALLINAMLIVPAATAALLCRNMRQLFWVSISLCLFAGVVGLLLSWGLQIPVLQGPGLIQWTEPGESGTIVLLSVLMFFAALPLRGWWRRRERRRQEQNAAAEALAAAVSSART